MNHSALAARYIIERLHSCFCVREASTRNIIKQGSKPECKEYAARLMLNIIAEDP